MAKCSPKVTLCKGWHWDSAEGWGIQSLAVLTTQGGLLSLPPHRSAPSSITPSGTAAPGNWGRGQPLLPRSIFDHPPCSAERASDCNGEPASSALSASHAAAIAFQALPHVADHQRGHRESRAPGL